MNSDSSFASNSRSQGLGYMQLRREQEFEHEGRGGGGGGITYRDRANLNRGWQELIDDVPKPDPMPVSVDCDDYKGKPNNAKPPQCRTAHTMTGDQPNDNSGALPDSNVFVFGNTKVPKKTVYYSGAGIGAIILVLAIAN